MNQKLIDYGFTNNDIKIIKISVGITPNSLEITESEFDDLIEDYLLSSLDVILNFNYIYKNFTKFDAGLVNITRQLAINNLVLVNQQLDINTINTENITGQSNTKIILDDNVKTMINSYIKPVISWI